jgi:hypothetical protein
METALSAPIAGSESFRAGRQDLVNNYSWAACMQKLVALI